MKNTSKIIVLLLIGGVFGVDRDEVKYEGDSVTLQTGITEIQKDHTILWRFTKADSTNLLVHIKENKVEFKPSVDGSFRGRLQVDSQTGDLTIRNIRMKYSGLYKVEINNPQTSYKSFNVTVKESPFVINAGPSDVKSFSVTEGESVTLRTDVQTQRGNLILWRFGDQSVLIAKGDMEDNKTPVYDGTDGRFRDRLKLNDQTGDLTISNSKTEHSGLYQLKIISNKQTTLYKTFNVIVREAGWSSGAVAGLCVIFLLVIVAVIAAGVILYHRMKPTVQERFVEEGESVTLSTAAVKGFRDAAVKLVYGGKGIIAEINRKDNTILTYDGADERFKGRLKLDDQTGALTISDLKTKHSGLYQLKTSSRGTPWPFSILGASYYQFNVIVTERIKQVEYGGTVTLHTGVTELQKDDLILWMTGAEDTHIAKFIVGTERPVFYNYTDDRFNDRLQINPQTGDLTINNITPEHCEVYKAQICSNQKSTYRDFKVSIKVPAEKGGSVGIKTGGEIKTGDQVEWSFRDDPLKRISYDKITLVTGVNGDSSKTKYTDKRFKGRLEMNAQTGDLNITKIRETDEGNYTLQQRSTEGKITNWVFSVLFGKFMSVTEGDRVALSTDVSELQIGTKIEWKFKGRVIMTGVMTSEGINVTYRDDQHFNGRVELNPNGSLIINNITVRDTGIYEVTITNNTETSHKRCYVNVTDNALRDLLDKSEKIEVAEGDPLTLDVGRIKLKTGTKIEWKFKGREIMTGVMTKDKGIHVKNVDQQFQDRLERDPFWGSITINNISKEDTGLYEVNITKDKQTLPFKFQVDVIARNEPTDGDHLLSEVV